MFFIQNSEGTIVAADKDFLDAAGFDSLLLLAEHFRSEHVGPDPEHGLLELNEAAYVFTVKDVQTLWGEGLLFEQVAPAESSLSPADETGAETARKDENDLPLVFDAIDERETIADTPPSADTEAESDATASVSQEEVSQEEDTLDDVLQLMELDEIEEIAEKAEADSHTDTAAIEEKTESADLKNAAMGGAAGLGAAAALKAAESFLSDKEASEPTEAKDELLELLDLSEAEEPSPAEANDADLHDEIARLFDEAEKEQASLEAATAETEPLGLIDDAHAEAETDEAPLELFELAEPQTEADHPEAVAKEDEAAEERFDLLESDTHTQTETSQDEAAEEHTHEPETPAERSLPKAAGIAYEQNARLIGISTGEYLTFLGQFVEESYKFEPGLRGRDLREFRSSLASLKDASQLLHLPQLTDKLRKLEGATSDEKEAIADDYYALIEQIREDLKTHSSSAALATPSTEASADAVSETPPVHEAHPPRTESAEEPPLELLSEETAPQEEAHDTVAEKPSGSSSEAVSTTLMTMQEVDAVIEKTASIPFDFSTNVASEELGLPEALVGEFVSDFIEQARENIPLILSAHQKGDMATVQSTAHLLKGAAANLRIDPLAKTLETLQHNEDPEKVPALFDRFVGQLKALKNLIHPHGLN